jgi:SAM-dependent methyltransferase
VHASDEDNMTYQTFPGKRGVSASLDKLIALRLPPLTGKRFLDVGCNKGFFCGYALFDAASQVVGIDRSKASLDLARQRFPTAEFHNQSWDTLPEGSYDVILLASALHYAEDQEALIHRLMSRLAEDGTLVLELGIVDAPKDEWVLIKRNIDERFFPTWGKISAILEKYKWKRVGCSVSQGGDETRRYVLHVHHGKSDALRMSKTTASIPESINGLTEADSSSLAQATEKANNYYKHLNEAVLINKPDTIYVKKIRNKKSKSPLIFEWYLEAPADSQIITDARQLNIAGWVLPSPNAGREIRCFVEGKEGRRCYELNVSRQDVIDTIYKDQKIRDEISKKCGFNFSISLDDVSSTIDLGFIIGDQELCVAEIGRYPIKRQKIKYITKFFNKINKHLRRIFSSK